MTLCMGRIRKEIMGRPPHAGRCSIARRASRKVALLFLQETKVSAAAGGVAGPETGIGGKPQKLGCEQ